jgi:hypothetical protein
MTPPTNENMDSWQCWSKYVINELERLNSQQKEMAERIENLFLELRPLQKESFFINGFFKIILSITAIGASVAGIYRVFIQ